MGRTAADVFAPVVEEILITVVGWAAFSVVSQYLQMPPFTAWVFPAQSVLLLLAVSLHALGVAIRAPLAGTFHLRVSSMYSCSVLALLVSHATLVGQSLGGGLDSTRATRGAYSTSQSEDWTLAVLGTTTWRRAGSLDYSVLDPGAPIDGTAVAGSMLGYAGIACLLSVYASYCSAPDGAWTPLVLEPKGLLIGSGFVGFLAVGALESGYRWCTTPILQIVLLGVYTCLLCIDRLIFDLVATQLLPSADGGGADHWWSMFQLGWYPVLSSVPPVYVLATRAGAAGAWASVALSGAAILVLALLWLSGHPYSGHFARAADPQDPSQDDDEEHDRGEEDPKPPSIRASWEGGMQQRASGGLRQMFIQAALPAKGLPMGELPAWGGSKVHKH